MGWGDEILVTGEAWALHDADSRRRPVVVLDRKRSPRWHQLWEGLDFITLADHPTDVLRMQNGPGCRPYIDYARMASEFRAVYPGQKFTTKRRDTRLPYRFTDHRVKRGRLNYFERPATQRVTVIEPHYMTKNPNRDWGWPRWQRVVDAMPDRRWVQINPPGARILDGVEHRPGGTFPLAVRLLARASLYVGPEGGLYHAAAALGIPAVGIFGGFVSPANQGYVDPGIVNLWSNFGETPCGQRVFCEHCREAMRMIKVEMVIDAIERAETGENAP